MLMIMHTHMYVYITYTHIYVVLLSFHVSEHAYPEPGFPFRASGNVTSFSQVFRVE